MTPPGLLPPDADELDDLTPPPLAMTSGESRRAERREDERADRDRLVTLEWRFRELRAKFETTQAMVLGLKSTMESQLMAVHGGQKLILERLTNLEALANKADGAWTLLKVLGVIALAGVIAALFVGTAKMIIGPTVVRLP